MKQHHISHRQIRSVVKASFTISALLFCFYLYDIIAPLIRGFVKTPPEIAANSADLGIGMMADKIFILIIPITVVFLIYIAIMMTTIMKNLKGTTVCSLKDHDCGFRKNYFS
jgi:hypothetical protein